MHISVLYGSVPVQYKLSVLRSVLLTESVRKIKIIGLLSGFGSRNSFLIMK